MQSVNVQPPVYPVTTRTMPNMVSSTIVSLCYNCACVTLHLRCNEKAWLGSTRRACLETQCDGGIYATSTAFPHTYSAWRPPPATTLCSTSSLAAPGWLISTSRLQRNSSNWAKGRTTFASYPTPVIHQVFTSSPQLMMEDEIGTAWKIRSLIN